MDKIQEQKANGWEIDPNSVEMVDMFPYDKVEKVMNAMRVAETLNDLDALKWCAKQMIMFFDIAETSTGTLSVEQAGRLFELAMIGMGAGTAPPASIAALVA